MRIVSTTIGDVSVWRTTKKKQHRTEEALNRDESDALFI